MLKDPTDYTKRKARRLGGTPTGRLANIIGLSIVLTTSSIAIWFGRSEIEWVKRVRGLLVKTRKPSEAEVLKGQMIRDPHFGAIMHTLNKRVSDKLDGVYVPEVPYEDRDTTEK